MCITVWRKQLLKPDLKLHNWSEDLGEEVTEKQMKALFKGLYMQSNIPKLRAFQYRLLHRSIILNTHLYRWGRRADNNCSMCNSAKETLTHFFFSCPAAQDIWKSVSDLCIRHTGVKIFYEKPIYVMFRQPGRSFKHLSNLLCLLTKHYLYKQRCLGLVPNSTELKNAILYHENIEKIYCYKNT